MIRISIILIISLFNVTSCNTQNKDNDLEVIELYNIQYSKIPPKYDKTFLSKISHIDSKYFSSGIAGVLNNKEVDFPINDKAFNYEFFKGINYIYREKVKLYVKRYVYKGKTYFIAFKIEKIY